MKPPWYIRAHLLWASVHAVIVIKSIAIGAWLIAVGSLSSAGLCFAIYYFGRELWAFRELTHQNSARQLLRVRQELHDAQAEHGRNLP